MKKNLLAICTLTLFLSGCGSDKPVLKKELTCQDDPTGRPREEQIAIGDACFRGGSFKKSSDRTW